MRLAKINANVSTAQNMSAGLNVSRNVAREIIRITLSNEDITIVLDRDECESLKSVLNAP